LLVNVGVAFPVILPPPGGQRPPAVLEHPDHLAGNLLLRHAQLREVVLRGPGAGVQVPALQPLEDALRRAQPRVGVVRDQVYQAVLEPGIGLAVVDGLAHPPPPVRVLLIHRAGDCEVRVRLRERVDQHQLDRLSPVVLIDEGVQLHAAPEQAQRLGPELVRVADHPAAVPALVLGREDPRELDEAVEVHRAVSHRVPRVSLEVVELVDVEPRPGVVDDVVQELLV
ncbi:unnamed protein product, partial [Ectocarpus sp. 12 AP-2014]